MTTYYMHTLDGKPRWKPEFVLCSGPLSTDGSVFRVSMSGDVTPRKIKAIIKFLSLNLAWAEEDAAIEQSRLMWQAAADLYV